MESSPAALEALQTHHLEAIPFENVDVRLGRPIDLDPGALQAKLVRRRRGGYCFEQNTLFAAVLGAFGFEVATLEARVRPPGATAPLPRTHMVLAVDLARRRWLTDVGFGGDGPLLPVPLDGEISRQPDGVYRVDREADGHAVLRRRWQGAWTDLYAFSTTPALAVDLLVANHFASTHPSSVFVQTLTVQRSLLRERRILRGRTYTVRRGREASRREIPAGELPSLLREDLGLDLTDREIEALARAERLVTDERDGRGRRAAGSSGINDHVSMAETTDR